MKRYIKIVVLLLLVITYFVCVPSMISARSYEFLLAGIAITILFPIILYKVVKI